MHGSTHMRKTVGNHITPLALASITDQPVAIPQSGKLTHIQFRRFAGCPICNLHVQSYFSRANELEKAGIQEVIIFHSSKENMLKHDAGANGKNTPYFMIADPKKKLYKQFGLENSWRALFSIKAMLSALKGLFKHGLGTPETLSTELVVPADFLIDEHGKVVALKYGEHAYDQWSVDELLELVQ